MKKSIKDIIKSLWRFPLKRRMRKQLRNRNFVLISSNCIGGCLLHDLGEPFNTPTINVAIPNFVSFCERLLEYLGKEPQVIDGENYPILKLDNVFVHGIHYHSKTEFLEAWTRRNSRFLQKVKQGAEIVIMAADAQLRENNARQRFLALPYKKICFTTNLEWVDGKEFIFVPEFKGQKTVGDLTKYKGFLGKRIFERHFDCVKFLNKKTN